MEATVQNPNRILTKLMKEIHLKKFYSQEI
ncbi:MAG: hypothetical protein JWM28_1923 [Chitinophagaceae bacterium]|nr:hypothetical protein [Chitinophagaceae bacterium]